MAGTIKNNKSTDETFYYRMQRHQDELRKAIDDAGVSEMFVEIPRQPAETIPALLCACDAAFVSFANDPIWEKTIPAKLQSYMACGKPIIASAAGETERIIKEAECGFCSPVGDENSLARDIEAIMQSDIELLGRHSLEYCRKNFDKTMLMNEMDSYIDD